MAGKGRAVALDRDMKTKKWLVITSSIERHPGLASGKAVSMRNVNIREFDSFHEAEEELKISFQTEIIDPVIAGIHNDGGSGT